MVSAVMLRLFLRDKSGLLKPPLFPTSSLPLYEPRIGTSIRCMWSRNLELGTWNLELGTWNLELGTWNLELGTWNSELGTRNSELGTRNSELGTWNLELGTWNLELGTRNLELGTRNSELGARNLELGTWNLELGTWNLELGNWNSELGTWNLEGSIAFSYCCGTVRMRLELLSEHSKTFPIFSLKMTISRPTLWRHFMKFHEFFKNKSKISKK
jgi:hypothetical protein